MRNISNKNYVNGITKFTYLICVNKLKCLLLSVVSSGYTTLDEKIFFIIFINFSNYVNVTVVVSKLLSFTLLLTPKYLQRNSSH